MSAEAPTSTIDGAAETTGAIGVVRLALADIKLAHTVFAMPFAVLASFLALTAGGVTPDWGRFAGQLALVVLCMIFARTWAMLVNRVADHAIDRDNPRTKKRAMASGRMRVRDGVLLALASAGAFLICCALFWVFFDNPWPTFLGAPTLLWIAFYSYTKRFTFLCHVFLGGALAFSPIAAAIAINPSALTSTPALWFIAGMVLFWVAGFDVAYALQDLDYDREVGLASIPATFGWKGALWVSRGFHVIAFALLVAAWRSDPRLTLLFGAAVTLVGALLVYEHTILHRRGIAGLPMAFFTINGVVSCVLGVMGSVDVLIAG